MVFTSDFSGAARPSSKLFTVLLVLGSGYTATRLASINQGWQLVLNIGFGTGAVYILRWYWSRINAWSEIVAMAVAAPPTTAASPSPAPTRSPTQKPHYSPEQSPPPPGSPPLSSRRPSLMRRSSPS